MRLVALATIGLVLLATLLVGPTSKAGVGNPWPPLRVHLSSEVEGWEVTFLITLENLTDQPIHGLTINAVPDTSTRGTTRLVGSWAGSSGQNPGVFDGIAVGWIHDQVAPRSKDGPFAFTVNYQRSAAATFITQAWVSWIGLVPGSVTSEELAITPPPPEPPARPIAVKRFWISRGWDAPPQAQFTHQEGVSYDVELEDLQPGDLIEFRVRDLATGQVVAASGQRLAPWGEGSFPAGVRAQSGGGIERLPPGSYRAEIYVNGRQQAQAIMFQVVPYTGPPSVCRGIGVVDVALDPGQAEEATRVGLAAGAVASTVRGPGASPGSIMIQFSVSPEVGPEANPRDKTMAETERIMAAIKERLASLGIPRENLTSLQTTPDCRLVGPSPWGTPPAAAAPGA